MDIESSLKLTARIKQDLRAHLALLSQAYETTGDLPAVTALGELATEMGLAAIGPSKTKDMLLHLAYRALEIEMETAGITLGAAIPAEG